MKKLAMMMLTVFACGAAYALPVGNPSEASLLTDGVFCEGKCTDWCDPSFCWCDAFSFRVGFYGDYIFDRAMEIGKVGHRGDGNDIAHFNVNTNAGYLALNILNRADLFATVGASNLSWETNATVYAVDVENPTGDRLKLQTETDFSWSVGGRITLWECGCTTLGIEGQYFTFKPDLKRITYAESDTIYPDDQNHFNRYSDWQVGLGISHRIAMVVPYAAVRWGQASYDQDFTAQLNSAGTLIIPDFENSKDWGYAVGVSLIDCEKALLTAEARFASEEALYVNAEFRF